MAFDGLITSLLGQGLAADRPAVPNIDPDAISFWGATDTDELSVYIDGAWVEDVLGIGAGDMLSANNLSDVANAGTSLTNLGLSANGKSLVTAADYAAMKVLLGLVIGTNVQAYNANLTTFAGIAPSANVQSVLGAANYAAIKTLLALTIGTDVQAYSAVLANVASSTYDAAMKPMEHIQIACSDESTAITTGTAKVTFRMPYAFTVTDVRASVNTAPTGSTILIDINEGGTTILSTKLMINASSKTSVGAATPYVISDPSLADDAEITIDFDQVGSTISGKGVKVTLIGHRT